MDSIRTLANDGNQKPPPLSEKAANILGSVIFVVLVVAWVTLPATSDGGPDEEIVFSEAIAIVWTVAFLVLIASSLGLIFFRPWAPSVTVYASAIALLVDLISYGVLPETASDGPISDVVFSTLFAAVFLLVLFCVRGRRISVEQRVSRKLHWTVLLTVFASAVMKAFRGSEAAIYVLMLFIPTFVFYWILEGGWRLLFRKRWREATSAVGETDQGVTYRVAR